MNLATFIILAIVVFIFVSIIISLYRKHKRGGG